MSKKRILVVEDDATLLETITYNLERQDYKVYQAADGPTGAGKSAQKRRRFDPAGRHAAGAGRL